MNYTVSFDESLNRGNQKKQMDMIVRFWDLEVNKVADKYFNSKFLGHATAADFLIHFKIRLAWLKTTWCKYPWMAPISTGSFIGICFKNADVKIKNFQTC